MLGEKVISNGLNNYTSSGDIEYIFEFFANILQFRGI